ncbi:MAG: GIY-YIG nuclease family protein [Candidatus Thorarchaeota archaeon]
MKGAYTLIIRIEQSVSIQIKSLGVISFKPGLWVYIGSAMGNGSTSLENRLNRHFRKEKTIYWHIDYLLDADTEIEEAIWAESTESAECDLAQSIEAHNNFKPGPRAFGSSDCRRGCIAHTYFYDSDGQIHNDLIQFFHKLGLQPHVTKTGSL